MRHYFMGSLVLVALAGCGRSFFEEREPWRHEAEETCLKSGAVKESAAVAMLRPITGPGMCGADFPLKVSALGEAMPAMSYTDDLRPPGSVPNGARYPQPIQQYKPEPYTPQPYAPRPYERGTVPDANSPYPVTRDQQPVSLAPPGLQQPPSDQADDEDDELMPPNVRQASPYPQRNPPYPPVSPVPLGVPRGQALAYAGPAAVSPAATLACPIVSALDRWIGEAVQPAAQKWFGQSVVEIRQISAYSCRGMNGQSGARISEHAFGNALDVAAFTLADGRKITVKGGWNGLPEEQGFLHDVQSAACDQFTTVLAPGSNAYHYDHIHVDLMRRSSGRHICQPGAIAGDVAAARARNRYARARDGITGSVADRRPLSYTGDDDDHRMFGKPRDE